MSTPASSRTPSFIDEPNFLAQLREATTTPSPISDILSDPSLMRALARPMTPRRSRHCSKAAHREKKSSPDVPLLGLVLAEEGRQSTQLRALLRSTADRLEWEMRRADAAEQRAAFAETRVRQVVAGVTAAQHGAELAATRAAAEVKRYELMLDGAQAELRRAQRDMDDVEERRVRAEREARQAREVARQYERAASEHEGRVEGVKRMQNRYVDGVEEGRKEGFEAAKKMERARGKKLYSEGFEAGRAEGYEEGNSEGRAYERRNAMEAFDKFLENEGYSDE